MHIAFVASQDSIHVCRWANALTERGYQITLLTMHPPKHELNQEVRLVKLPFPQPAGYVLNIPHMRRILKKLNPDIVHAFYAFGYGFMARMSGIKPTVLSVMGSEVFHRAGQNKVFKYLIKRNLFDATQLCSTSEVMAQKIWDLYGNDLNVELTPFGVDTQKFSPTYDEKTETEYDFIVGTVKLLKPYYGPDILLKAFAKFCEVYPDKRFKLIMVGGGDDEGILIQLAKKLNVYKDCEFTGNIQHKEIPKSLNKFDVYLALSRRESFGVAVLEASACSLPVIVSDAGGLPEIVNHGETGLVVPKENIEETTQALIKLFEDRELASTLGKNGRNRVLEKYSWHHSLDIMEGVYKKALTGIE